MWKVRSGSLQSLRAKAPKSVALSWKIGRRAVNSMLVCNAVGSPRRYAAVGGMAAKNTDVGPYVA